MVASLKHLCTVPSPFDRQPQCRSQYLTNNFPGGCSTNYKLIRVPALILLVVLGNSCFASLGDDATSVQEDQVHIQATLRITQKSGYVMHELQTPTGQTVREYVSSSGKVFAVAWHGPWSPDLKQLLGSHFEEYRQALQQRGAARGPVTVQLPDMVVQLGGHMRDFVGRAYLPSDVPADVRVEDLR